MFNYFDMSIIYLKNIYKLIKTVCKFTYYIIGFWFLKYIERKLDKYIIIEFLFLQLISKIVDLFDY